MEFLSELWLPIVVSAFLVWVTSFITHVLLPHHKSEWKGLPNEDDFSNLMRSTPAGKYMFPFGSMNDMKEAAFQEKMNRGPNGLLILWDGPVSMGRNLGLTLLFYLVVGVFVAYLGFHAIEPTDDYLARFRLCGTAALLAHGFGWISFFIWFRYGNFWPNFLDAVLYAGVTAGTFAWLWPVA